MSHRLTGTGMNEKVKLSVFNNRPHIWSGGLEGEGLAQWLTDKANAIRYQISRQIETRRLLNQLDELKNSDALTAVYVNLRLSHKESDPILPLSAEAIQFDMEVAASVPVHKQCAEDIAIPPVGYSLSPDLAEEQAGFHQTKGVISALESSQCGEKSGE